MTTIRVDPGDPIQTKANALQPGDELVFAPGVHYGRLYIPVDDVTISGESGAVIEGTDPVSSWELATDGDDYCSLAGTGTYRAAVPTHAWHLVDSAGNCLHMIHPDYVYVKEPHNYYKTAFEAMCVPNGATTPADYGANWWDGIEAYWAYNRANGHAYVRYRDGRAPSNMRFCPDASVIDLYHRKNVTIRNLGVRGGLYGIRLWDSPDVTIKGCRVTASHIQVYIYAVSTNARVTENYFNLSMLGTIASQPLSKTGSAPDPDGRRAITFHQYCSYKFFRDKSGSTGGCGVAVWNGWDEASQTVEVPKNIEIDHNHCERSTYHVDLSGGDGIDIHHNYTNNMMDMSFQRGSNNGRNVKIHDNQSHEAGYQLLRWHHPEEEAGDNYVYNNKVSDVEGAGDFFAFTGYNQSNPTSNLRMWIYQNSFNGGNMTAVHSGVSSMNGLHWINNILPYGPQMIIPCGKVEGNFQGSHVWPTDKIERDFIVPEGHGAMSCAVDISTLYPSLPDAARYTGGQAGWIASGEEMTTLTVTPDVVAPGAQVEVSWTGSVSNKDWYALYKVDDPEQAWDKYGWAYTSSCGHSAYEEPVVNGMCMFTMPTELGDYSFKLFENDGDTLLAAASITVTDEPEPEPEPEPDMIEVMIKAWVKREDVTLVPQKKKGKK